MTSTEFREARRTLGLTQLELARTMGVSKSQVESLEYTRSPYIREVYALAISELLRRKAERAQ